MSLNFSAFEIGRRALKANQFGIGITGQNISNVNTPGYARQRVLLAETSLSNIGGVSVGNGVSVQGVQAFRDRFLEARIQSETGIAGRLGAQSDSIRQVETVLQGTENGGLQSAISNFFGSFRELDANPNSLPLRAIAAQKGSALAGAFQATRSRLTDIRSGIDGQIRINIDEVNSLTGQVANLNGQIRDAQFVGGDSFALESQRGELVTRLSELTGARTTQNSDGTINLTIGEGRSLVGGDKAFKIDVASTPPLGFASLTIEGNPITFDDGAIGGLQKAIDFTTGHIDAIDSLAAQIVAKVNTAHASGTDFDGNAGVNFFTGGSPITAANFTVNAAIVSNPHLVVASPVSQPGQNGTVAGEIANLLTDQNITVGTHTGSFTSIFGSLVSEAGEQINQADSGLQTQAAIIAQASAQRESISGVSLDEEAVNLLQYQKAYEAAARFLKVADEMTQTILSLAG
jgi:flagellar hook-associated protein 1